MTILYSNGCSYTANYEVDRNNRYPLLVANHFGWQVMDKAHPGSCNDRIIRCTMRDCLSLLDKKQPIVALIQLTHLFRTEYAGTPTPETEWKYWNDELFESIKPNEPNLPDLAEKYLEHYLLLFDQQAAMVKLMTALIGLTCFFQQHQIDYIIFSGPMELKNFREEAFYHYLAKDTGVLDLKKFTMLDLIGKSQHPDQQDMKIIADYFVDLLTHS